MTESVSTANNLLIGEGVTFTGSIEARVIDVHGELLEDITSKERMSIRHTGQVTGVLQYAELEIERGGRFQGDMKQG
jgi:cytoskeletal protein CcmA (bactofilin family)